jgi:hypothetical protein
MSGIDDLKNRFGYHQPPDEVAVKKHQAIRQRMYETALVVVDSTPSGREQSLAITKLEEAMMWSNAAIARVHPITEDPS